MSNTQPDINIWRNTRRPIGVLVIIPGMCECACQYDVFAKFLNQNRYIVVGINNVAKHTFIDATRQIKNTICDLKNKYKLPVFVFGHGYGGFIARKLLMIKNLCSGGVCLSGISKYPRAALHAARGAAWLGIKIFGHMAHAPEYHGCRHTFQFYYSMIDNIMKLSTRIATNIPILIINGGDGLTARKTTALYNNYRENDMHNLTLILYPYGNNNLVLGPNAPDVQKDILEFLKSVQ